MISLGDFKFLMTKPKICEALGISMRTLERRLEANAYKRFVWINDNGTMKVTRDSVENQIESMKVNFPKTPTLSEVGL